MDRPEDIAEALGWMSMFAFGPLCIGRWGAPSLGAMLILVGAIVCKWVAVGRCERRIDRLEERNAELLEQRDRARHDLRSERSRADAAERSLRDLAAVREQFSRSSIN